MQPTKVKEVRIDPIKITYVTEDGKKHVEVLSKAYYLVEKKAPIKTQATREQLIEAAKQLLSCFQNIDRWPKLWVAISKATWYAGSVDDSTRDAIRRLGKLTGVINNGQRESK